MTSKTEGLRPLLQQARVTKNALLEASDEVKAFLELLDGSIRLVDGQPKPKGRVGARGLLRAAEKTAFDTDKLALDALTKFMDALHCVEQAVTDGPILICRGCDAQVRITQALADSDALKKGASCVACHGELVPITVAGIAGLGDPS
jgi:hypothetical protein